MEDGTYQERYFGQDQLTYDSSSDLYTLTDTKGDQICFDNFSTSLPAQSRGQIESYTDVNGNVTRVTAHTSNGRVQEIQQSSTSGGNTTIESYL